MSQMIPVAMAAFKRQRKAGSPLMTLAGKVSERYQSMSLSDCPGA